VTLESAHQLLRTLTSNSKFSGGVDTAEMLEDVLDGIGFGGLWRSSTFHVPNEQDRQCTALTDRLIEVCHFIPSPSTRHILLTSWTQLIIAWLTDKRRRLWSDDCFHFLCLMILVANWWIMTTTKAVASFLKFGIKDTLF
jgi:hypothetical protein